MKPKYFIKHIPADLQRVTFKLGGFNKSGLRVTVCQPGSYFILEACQRFPICCLCQKGEISSTVVNV